MSNPLDIKVRNRSVETKKECLVEDRLLLGRYTIDEPDARPYITIEFTLNSASLLAVFLSVSSR